MTALHPAVTHHVVNTLGWSSLRPLQHAAVEPLMAGRHALLLAPTAGGKTEAAVFPLLSRVLAEDWRGLSVLYVCPLRALLNDLHPRVERYAGLVGRRAGLWHGDVGRSARDRLLAEPPDVLLTTPESLEGMLVSARVDHRTLFARVRAVVVDEVHAFAGDDRGWHLLAVLERVSRLAGRELQRVGLSATVGDPAGLLAWLTTTCRGPAVVLDPPAEDPHVPEVTLDHVGDLTNAAILLSRLHRGEKRLVFVDSRAGAERLATELRRREVTTFVSHGSLGRDERRRAEAAFAEGRDRVIVATSTLELGVDVGDLDRVVQIDAPHSVASFLQRLGRTGRRPGAVRNALFLATGDDALLRAAALLHRWAQGAIEPTVPPPMPLHLLAQQVMALTLQEGGIGRHLWKDRLGDPLVLGEDAAAHADTVVDHMVDAGLLHDDQGLLGVGRAGEEAYGRRHFLELLAVFTAPPEFTVLRGQTEIGRIPDRTLQMAEDGPRVLLLAGRAWFVRSIDWRRRVVFVEPSDRPGIASWFGAGRALSASLCRAIREVLTGVDPATVTLSRRATSRLAEVRDAHAWVEPGHTALVREADGSTRWWTFAGLLANVHLAEALAPLRAGTRQRDNLAIRLAPHVHAGAVRDALHAADDTPTGGPAGGPVADDALRGLKFSDCLPEPLARRVVAARLDDRDAALQARAEPIVVSQR